MSEPTTAAGRSLLDYETPIPPDYADPAEEWVADTWALRNEMEGRILAIEAEARRAALDEAIAAVLEHNRVYADICHHAIDALTRLRDGA